jgi:cell wall-associated NlpC family hydrolase
MDRLRRITKDRPDNHISIHRWNRIKLLAEKYAPTIFTVTMAAMFVCTLGCRQSNQEQYERAWSVFSEVSTESKHKLEERNKPICSGRESKNQTVLAARKYLGVKYRWGGRSTDELDCLGLIFLAHQLGGMSAIYDSGGYRKEFARTNEKLLEGDYIFFLYADAPYSDRLNETGMPLDGTNYYVYHTAISTGGGCIIHANPAFPNIVTRREVIEEPVVDLLEKGGYEAFAVVTNAAQQKKGQPAVLTE